MKVIEQRKLESVNGGPGPFAIIVGSAIGAAIAGAWENRREKKKDPPPNKRPPAGSPSGTFA